jgi:hypothetical protein
MPQRCQGRRKPARWLADATGVSAGYVRSLIAVAQAFPDPATRAADLSFSHHLTLTAFLTDGPAGWPETAVAHQWSVREFRQAIRGAADPIADAERARRAAEAPVRAVERYNKAKPFVGNLRKACLSIPPRLKPSETR